MFLKAEFIGPVKGGPHHPYFQVRFHMEDISPPEPIVTSVGTTRPLPDIRQETH